MAFRIAMVGSAERTKPVGAFRSRVAENVARLLPQREATLVSGTVLGVDQIDKSFKDELTKTGTIHVVVVSGQNLTIVAGLFLSLARYIGRRQSLVLAIAVCFLYAILTGFQAPVIRAMIMVVVASVAIYLGREANQIIGIGLAAALILIVWPQAILEISFQLTFAATLGIVLLGRRLAQMWSKVPILGENAAIATSAYLFTAPLIMFHFGRVSLLSPIANVLVAEAVSPVMILGFLVVGASLILLPLAQFAGVFAYVPAFYFVKVVDIFAGFNVGLIELGKGNLALAAFFYFLTLALILIWTRPNKSAKSGQ